MRSASCQSGPCSRMTTFLPAFASTAAKTEPDAPAPTMTTSTFSFAMSPPLGRRDVGPIGNAEGGIAIHGAVDDVDGIAAQHQIDEWSRRTLPALDLVLAHIVDQAALLRFAELNKRPAVIKRLTGVIDGPERRAIEIRIGRAHIEDARFEQRLLRRALHKGASFDVVHEVLLPGARLGALGSSPSTEETGGGRCLLE